MKVAKLRSIDGLIPTALLLALLFTGCVTTQQANANRTSQEPPPTSLPPEMKGSVRTIGVLLAGDPQFDMSAYKNDQQAEAGRAALVGGLSMFGTTMAVGVFGMYSLFALVEGSVESAGGAPTGSPSIGQVVAYVLPAAVVTGSLGAGVGLVIAGANSIPEKRAKEIEASVLPALSGFPFQEILVEQIRTAGNSNTEYCLANANAHSSEEIDTMLEMSALNVGLRKVENILELSAGVRAQLVEKDTGTVLAQRTFSHAWKTFGKNKPVDGDESLTREEIDGCLRVLSEDIVDTLFLREDFPTLVCVGVSGFPFGKYSDGLQPKYPKLEKSGTVDSLQPRLEWVAFPSKQDREMDKKGKLEEIGQVSYDLRIWRLAEEMHRPTELVYECTGLVDPWHTVDQPLERGKTYYWAIRARFVRNGRPATTQWTTCPGFLPLITREGTFADSFSSQLSGRYKFSTPPLPQESSTQHPPVK